MLFSEKEQCPDTFFCQGPTSSGENTKETRTRFNRRGVRSSKFGAQGGPEMVFEASPVAYITLAFPDGSGRQTAEAVALRIGGRYLLTYEHGLYMADGTQAPIGSTVTLTFKNEKFSWTLSEENIALQEGSELCLLRCDDKTMPMQKNYLHKFATVEQYRELNGTIDCILMGPTSGTASGHGTRYENGSYSGRSRRWEATEVFKSDMVTLPGHCGLPTYAMSGTCSGLIVGIHVAGGIALGRSQAFAIPALREEIQEMMSALEPMKAQGDDASEIQEGDPLHFENYFQAQGKKWQPQIYDVVWEKRKELPNLAACTQVPYNERVFISTESKIKPSAIAMNLPFKDSKEPAILNPADPRAEGVDPVLLNVLDTLGTDHKTDISPEVLDRCSDSCYQQYADNMTWPIGRRQLTIEEAVAGVPGVLSSIKLKTSPGIPLCYIKGPGKGKTRFVRLNANSEPVIDPAFRQCVEAYVKQIDTGNALPSIFCGFLKDETLSVKKIRQKRTRITYCGDLIANVAFRMKFGCVLAAMQNSHASTPSAIGVNQFSNDMQEIYDYLTKNGIGRFQAGDFANFDKRHHPMFREAAYKIVRRLLGDAITDEQWEVFLKHETCAAAQVGDCRMWIVSCHLSGCFLTAIINNIVNELYHRYCFALEYPDKIFDDWIRLKVLGDDHILNILEGIEWTGPMIQRRMAEIGQEYTSDKKDQEIEDYQDFDKITFLGAYPRLVDGIWTGAVKKETAWRAISWTKDDNASLEATCRQMIELMSQWDEKTFRDYKAAVNYALVQNHFPPITTCGYKELQKIVAERTAGKEVSFRTDFAAFQCQGVEMQCQGDTSTEVRGLTTLQGTETKGLVALKETNRMHEALSESPLDLSFGVDSLVFRTELTWNASDGQGTVIGHWFAPGDILALGSVDNYQNMPFKYSTFWRGQVEMVVQVNCNQFTQGALCLYWYPLRTEYDLNIVNWTAQPHVLLTPKENSSSALRVPFNYPLGSINLYAIDQGALEQSLGTFVLGVLSPLVSTETDQTATVTIWSRFLNSEFVIPRPLNKAPLKSVRAYGKPRAIADPTELPMKAQGQGQSTNYNIHENYISNSGGGTVPIQEGPSSMKGNSQKFDTKLDAQVVPMDHPPNSGQGVWVQPQFQSMAMANGGYNTNMMALHPANVETDFFDELSGETDIQYLCNKKGIITSFKWKTSDAPGTELTSFSLDSVLGAALGSEMPVCLYIINQFTFWRAEFEFEFRCFKTDFHKGRLQVSTSYGSPTAVTAEERSVVYSNVLEFTDSDVEAISVPWNTNFPFLRTWEGPAVLDPVQRYSQGWTSVFVANGLRAPSSVAQEVEVIVFVSLKNVLVARPKALPLIQPIGYFLEQGVNIAAAVEEEPEMVTQGDDATEVHADPKGAPTVERQQEEVLGDEPNATAVPLTHESAVQLPRPCKLQRHLKMPNRMADLMEVWRRPTAVPNRCQTMPYEGSNNYNVSVAQVSVFPMFHNTLCLFAGWAGGLRYRVKIQKGGSATAAVYPTGGSMFGFNPAALGCLTAGGDQVTVSGQKITTSMAPANKPLEWFYTVGDANSGNAYLDFTSPYFSQFNFMEQTNVAFQSNGTVYSDPATFTDVATETIVFTMNDQGSGASIDVFEINQSAGDNFRAGVFACWKSLQLKGPTGTVPVGKWNLGGYYAETSS